MFALVDCNNFFASCERVFRPDLNGKPIVVLSNNDGCVIARSNEAKALGIPMGAPAFEFQNEFRRNNIHVFSSNYELYGDMSRRVMDMLREYAPDMEEYSIDEAFLKLTGFKYFDLQTHFQEARERVHRGTGIPISIGIAPTKSLAKLANRIAKKFPERTGGVYVIDSEEKRIKALKWLDVGDVWGIGRRHAKRLREECEVKTAYDFLQVPDSWVQTKMSIVGIRLKRDLSGEPTLEMEDLKPKKNIATTRSFERNIKDLSELKERMATFAMNCAAKLRKQNSVAKSVNLFVLTNSHRSDLPQYNKSIAIKLPFASNSGLEIVPRVNRALESIFKPGYEYKKAGVIMGEFVPDGQQQMTLFGDTNEKHKKLWEAVDRLNDRYGMQKIRLARQDQKRIWKMRQEQLSPRYTTRIDEILIVNCK